VTGEWRKLYERELRDLYSSPNVILVMKSRRRWAGHVARMGDKTGACRVLVGTCEGKRLLGNPGLNGRIIIIINWIFKKLDGQAWTGLL
jgi:hypothetical protein